MLIRARVKKLDMKSAIQLWIMCRVGKTVNNGYMDVADCHGTYFESSQ